MRQPPTALQVEELSQSEPDRYRDAPAARWAHLGERPDHRISHLQRNRRADERGRPGRDPDQVPGPVGYGRGLRHACCGIEARHRSGCCGPCCSAISSCRHGCSGPATRSRSTTSARPSIRSCGTRSPKRRWWRNRRWPRDGSRKSGSPACTPMSAAAIPRISSRW